MNAYRPLVCCWRLKSTGDQLGQNLSYEKDPSVSDRISQSAWMAHMFWMRCSIDFNVSLFGFSLSISLREIVMQDSRTVRLLMGTESSGIVRPGITLVSQYEQRSRDHPPQRIHAMCTRDWQSRLVTTAESQSSYVGTIQTPKEEGNVTNLDYTPRRCNHNSQACNDL